MADVKIGTPEQRRVQRIGHLIMMGLKFVLLGMVFLIALDGGAKLAAEIIGALLEVCAVVCFVKAYRVWRPGPPRPPRQVAPYSALQESMEQRRAEESASPGGPPRRSPVNPR